MKTTTNIIREIKIAASKYKNIERIEINKLTISADDRVDLSLGVQLTEEFATMKIINFISDLIDIIEDEKMTVTPFTGRGQEIHNVSNKGMI